MKLSLLALAALLTFAAAAVVEPQRPKDVGPLSPEKDPRTSLTESIRRMRLTIDRELVFLARMEEMSRTRNTHGLVARQATDGSDYIDHGFTDKVNEGTDPFKPTYPGANIPSARQFSEADMSPEPSMDPAVPPTTDPIPSSTDSPPVPTEPVPVPSTPVTGTPMVTMVPVPSVVPDMTTKPDVDESPMPVPTDVALPSTPIASVVPTELPAPVATDGPATTTAEPTAVATVPGDVTTGPTESETAVPSPTLDNPAVSGLDPSPTADVEVTTTSTGTPSPTAASATSPSDDDSVCFPARAMVTLADGNVKRMDKLSLGDMVHVGGGKMSSVFMFTHKLSTVRYPFVELKTISNHSLALTRGHYLYVNGEMAAASTVQVGDVLQLGDKSLTQVTQVNEIVETGLYNPQTVDGDLIVDGVRVSTYTTAVAPRTAHALLMPLRGMFKYVGLSMRALESGADELSRMFPSGPLVM